MSQNFEIALSMYERALVHFAQRAGRETISLTNSVTLPQAEKAAKLALGDKADQDVGPALQSILGRLFGQNLPGIYLPQAMTNHAAQPRLALADADEVTQAYSKTWQEFEQDYQATLVLDQALAVREANLHSLLQRYCWAMPAPGADDVSLFDFARVSAALAVCLDDDQANDEQVALLVGADLSGVQEWLYTLSSTGAARSLRGRSVYLQLLMEVIALDLLEKLGLPMANLLYVGGGNFYLLAPVSAQAKISAYQQEASHRLLKMHKGALYVAMDFTPLSKGILTGTTGKIGQAWDQVNQKLNQRKGRRFAELPVDEMAKAIGSPLGDPGSPEKVCRVCQRIITDQEIREGRIEEVEDTASEGGQKCALCVSFQALGGMLSKADSLVMAQTDIETAQDVSHWQDGLRNFGYHVHVTGTELSQKASMAIQGSALVRLFYWQSSPAGDDFASKLSPAHTVRTYRPLAQCVPVNGQGKTLTFYEIQKESQGIERWGVLRMDVDNLGEIFQKGLPQSSLCHVVGLSGLMRLFFEGLVPELASALNQEKPRIHLMYAGGDDLFVVGAWSYLPELAATIQKNFTDFACHNPCLTISGGISIALAEKYPLYQAAREAGEAEEQAKAYDGVGGKKNALNFLGETMTWANGSQEKPIYNSYGWVAARKEQLVSWLSGENALLPRSFLMTLRAIDAEWREWVKQEEGIEPRYRHEDKSLYLGPWQWHLVYSLMRVGERCKDSRVKHEVMTFAKSLVGYEISVLGVMARWTEFLTRGEEL